MQVQECKPGDRVRVINRALENGKLYGREGTIQDLSGAVWPLNVILDESEGIGSIPFDWDEVEYVEESGESAELKAVREALNEEEKRTERFARQIAVLNDTANARFLRIEELKQEKQETNEELYDLREEKARSELAVRLWKDACTKAETELEELKQALTTLAS